jgi:hypothetical protein
MYDSVPYGLGDYMANDIPPIPPLVTIANDQLVAAGFTANGCQNFQNTVREYSKDLLDRSVNVANLTKVENMRVEVTHEHVRTAATSLAQTFGKPSKSKWLIAGQIVEYLATAVAGVGGGHLDKQAGIIAFAVGLTVAVVLVVVRLTQSKAE